MKDSVVWVIGGGSGIGRAIALKAAAAGARVWISGRREDSLKKTAQVGSKYRHKINLLPFDLSLLSAVILETSMRLSALTSFPNSCLLESVSPY